MGQIGEKCSCLYDKTEKTTYNFEQESGNKPSSNSNKNFNAKNFLNAKVRSGSLIKSPTVKNNSYTPKYTNIDKSIAVKYPNLSDDHISLIVSLQSHARGLILRKHFAKNLKSKLEDHTYKEIDRFTKLFRTPTLIKAELNASNQFEPHGWTKYYPKDNNFFKFDYGFVLNTKLLVYDDVGVYFGQVNLDSFKHGQGTLLTKGGSKYQGSWRFNKFTGWGRHIDSDGNFYEGAKN